MANYVFYDGSIAGTPKLNEATPGDTNTMSIRRGFVDSTKQTLNAADVARVFPVYAGEIIIGAVIRVHTAESTSNAAVDVGVDGGSEFGTDAAVTTINTVTPNFAASYWVAANGNFTLVPNNAVALDTGVIEVMAFITKGFTKL
jgi:hypothetical protein